MNNPTERLLEYQKKIDSASSELSEIKGQLKSNKEQWISKFNVHDLQTAERKLKKIREDLEKMEADLENGIKELDIVFHTGEL